MRSLKAKKKDDHNDEKTSEEDDIDTNQIRRLRFNYKVFIEYQKDLNSSNAIKSKMKIKIFILKLIILF